MSQYPCDPVFIRHHIVASLLDFYDHRHYPGQRLIGCPACGCGETHIRAVTVWMRGEDEDCNGIRFSRPDNLQGADPPQAVGAAGNPSPRREGLTIEFICEQCDDLSVLKVWQHKGPSFCEWEIRPGQGEPKETMTEQEVEQELEWVRQCQAARKTSGM